MLEAAERVFAAQGYAGARIDDIAEEAGVAAPTVYKVFGNKRTVLVAAVNRAMAGDEGEGELDQQAWFTEQLDEPDPRRQLEMVARNARQLYERAGPVLEVLRAAAPLDTELADAWDDISAARVKRSRRTATNLHTKAGPRARMTVDDTAFTLLSLTSPELYAVHAAAGRTAAHYERWLTDVLCSTLLT
jgi:AcrR family transcriptional regulator